ncbi:LysR family transcriptional regulator [Stenotrophomonas sp. SY1]|jgi:DNA-binding transcriptional LysR family regulator|uniref:LysR family transcriptional regulator n=1 Tax=Stenotrophomonas sp. SY1 TaxID=477235 RepID=UPI001E51F234|nr:LysR family transcriptional regulator [Stenotrophomonas sp. SY1]MCD9086862.1 LysR family transcriptional regulator [Stenotrophomonas sp. SY1]
MHLSLRQLQIFCAIAEAGTTTAAGETIGLSQSAVSAALNELESLLGLVLFDRVGRRLVLNAHGRALLPEARALLAGMADIERRFSTGREATAPVRWRVGASTTIGNYLMPGRIADLLERNGHAHVDLVIGNTREVTAAVQHLEVDIGLIEGPNHEPGLEVAQWLDDELVIVYGPRHPQATALRAGADLAQLRQACWLLREPGSGTREAAEQALLPHLHGFAEVLQLGGTEAIKQGAVAGLGLACLSRHAVADLVALGKLQVLDTPLPRLHRQLWVVRHPGKRVPASLRQLLGLPADVFVDG